MKVKNDHRSKFSNLSNWKEEVVGWEGWQNALIVAVTNYLKQSLKTTRSIGVRSQIFIIIIITLIVKSSKGFSSTIYNNICIPKNNKNVEKFKNLKLRESLP